MAHLVTVVIPTRNRRSLLARTLHTVRSQQGVDLEVVVVDDGSNDGTSEYVSSLADPSVRIVRHDTAGGVARARNAGIEAARGEWVAFLDDDDLWAPGKLAAQLAALERDGAARWACSGAVVVDADLRVVAAHRSPSPEGDLAGRFLAENQLGSGGSNVVASTELLRSLGGFDPRLSHTADRDLWIRLALSSRLASVDRCLMAYVVHGGAQSQRTEGAEAEYDYLLQKHAGEMAQRNVTPKLDYWWAWVAEQHARAGRRSAALRVNARIFRRYRHWSWLPTMTAMTIAPRRTMSRRDRRQGRGIPAGWREEAEGWLAPLRGCAEAPEAAAR